MLTLEEFKAKMYQMFKGQLEDQALEGLDGIIEEIEWDQRQREASK